MSGTSDARIQGELARANAEAAELLAELEDRAVESIVAQRPAAERKSQRIALRCVADLPRIAGDALWLRQVLDNLLSNAVKYSPRGSIIAVDLVAEAGGIAVTVIDEGPGLTPDDLCQAFGEFARLSAQPTGGESSHGLGLAIVKRIVELHGGRAWAENRDDRSGARFGFWVPVGGPAGTDCRCR